MISYHKSTETDIQLETVHACKFKLQFTGIYVLIADQDDDGNIPTLVWYPFFAFPFGPDEGMA